MSAVSVDLVVPDQDEPVWSGRLAGVPPTGTVIDIGLGAGPAFEVTGPAQLRCKDYAFGGIHREHEVAVAIVPVARR